MADTSPFNIMLHGCTKHAQEWLGENELTPDLVRPAITNLFRKVELLGERMSRIENLLAIVPNEDDTAARRLDRIEAYINRKFPGDPL